MNDRELIGLVYNPRVPEAAGLVRSLVTSLKLDNSWVGSSVDLGVSGEDLARTSVIITAGGDGTILRVVRATAPYSIPLLGINMGRVGFMTELTVEEAAERIPSYLDGSPRIETRMMLRASATSRAGDASPLTVHALNDVVVARGAAARLLDIDVSIDGAHLATYRADGVVAATATGSTGYALAAGGPVVHPEAGVVLIQPVAPHISLQAGLVVPAESVVEIAVARDQEAVLTVDGFADSTVRRAQRVMVDRSPHVARFLRAGPKSAFYSTLTQRLGVTGPQAPETPGPE